MYKKILNELIYNYLIKKLIKVDNTIKIKDVDKLDEFVKNIVMKKKTESHHIIDSGNEACRWRTGMGGEMALEQLLGKPFVDFSIGDSKDYHTPDLKKIGIDVGIKSVEKGKYPIIFKKSYKPEIIVLKLDDENFCILGLATVDVLNKYQDDDLILSPALKARGTKTAFTGLYKLKPFSNFDELIKLIN